MQSEISLREIFDIFWDGKKTISIITISILLLTAILNFFVLPATYEATATVRLGNGMEQQESGQNLNAYLETLKNDVSMQRLIEKLDLEQYGYTIANLKSSINISIVNQASVMKLSVQGEDPEIITNIANMMAFELGARMEITDRSQEIVAYKRSLKDIENQINVYQKDLDEANRQLSRTPEKLYTKQTLADEPYLQSVVGELIEAGNKELGAIQLETEIINPVYTTLQSHIANKTIELARLTSQKENLELNIKENQERILELETQIDFEKLNSQNSERLLNGFNAVFVSPAIEPTEPVGPKKIVNIALATIVGFMLATVIVFIRNYLKVTDLHPTKD